MRHPCILATLLAASGPCFCRSIARNGIDLDGIVDAGLRGGWSAVLPLERGFNAGTGPLGKRFAGFDPNIDVAGLSHTAFGTHAFGRQYGPSGHADNVCRLDNTVRYTLNTGARTARAEGTGRPNGRHGTGLTPGLMQKF